MPWGQTVAINLMYEEINATAIPSSIHESKTSQNLSSKVFIIIVFSLIAKKDYLAEETIWTGCDKKQRLDHSENCRVTMKTKTILVNLYSRGSSIIPSGI